MLYPRLILVCMFVYLYFHVVLPNETPSHFVTRGLNFNQSRHTAASSEGLDETAHLSSSEALLPTYMTRTKSFKDGSMPIQMNTVFLLQ